MNVPPGSDDARRQKWLAALSVTTGVLVGVTVGPCLLFFLWVFAFPVGVLVGGLIGAFWGRLNLITTTGFGSLGIVLAEAVFVFGQRLLPFPACAFTWILAPVVAVLAIRWLPRLAAKIWPDSRSRENRAIGFALAYLFLAFGTWHLLPPTPLEKDKASGKVQMDFFRKCDALADAEGHRPAPGVPPRPAAHILRLRQFPELCCPGIVAPMRNHEVGMGDWHIVMHFITRAQFAETVRYYQILLTGRPQHSKSVDVSYPCTRVDGSLHGEAVSVVIGDVPERGVSIAIF